MEHILNLNIRLIGDYGKYVTDDEIFEFLRFKLQGGSINNDNPLFDESKDCDISLISIC